MAKEEKGAVEEMQPVKNKKSTMKIVIVALSVLVIMAGGVLGALYYFSGAKKVEKTPVPRPVIGALWPMDPFIVNLLDNQGERYLKLVIQVEVSDQPAIAELEQLKPKLRDNVLDLLTAKTYSELMEPGGKQRLRDEIAMRLNSYLIKGKITKVYFTDFVIQ